MTKTTWRNIINILINLYTNWLPSPSVISPWKSTHTLSASRQTITNLAASFSLYRAIAANLGPARVHLTCLVPQKYTHNTQTGYLDCSGRIHKLWLQGQACCLVTAQVSGPARHNSGVPQPATGHREITQPWPNQWPASNKGILYLHMKSSSWLVYCSLLRYAFNHIDGQGDSINPVYSYKANHTLELLKSPQLC